MAGPVRVLVVDDEPVSLAVMARIVSAAGYQVLQATTGTECLEVVERERPDLILLDVLLPDLDGPVVSARIKSTPDLGGTYIILVSEKRITRDDRIRGLAGGADAYLPRPFTHEELLAYVETGIRIRGLLAGLEEENERRRRSEAEVRESNSLLSMAESMASLGSWKWNPRTGEFLASRSLLEILESSAGSGELPRDMRPTLFGRVHPDDRHLVEDCLAACLSGHVPAPCECRLLRPGGGLRWLRWEMRAMPDAGGDGIEVCGCVLDITERLEREEGRLRLARLEEEQRLARQREMVLKNLHDGIGGITANISLLSEVGRRARSLEEARRSFETICTLAREGMEEVRGVMEALECTPTTWGDLLAEMRRYGRFMLEPHDITLDVHVSGDGVEQELEPLPCRTLLNLFKEAVANVIKHAHARRVSVEASVDHEAFRMTFRDDGVGMQAPSRTGRGLRNMAARAAQVGGTVSFAWGPGTTVTLAVPLQERGSAR